jgi:hypothetical protein
MHSTAWVTIFQQVPASENGNLMLVTSVGIEIAIQCVLRIDREFVALKGRVAGSQDAGRVFFIPYDQIVYFGFQQAVKESDFHEMFGSMEIPSAPEDAPTPAVPAPPVAAEALPAPTSKGEVSRSANVTPPPGSGFRAPLTIKSTVLEKFRSRTSAPGTAIRPAPDE